MRVIVIGADGQLGTDVVRAFSDHGDVVSPLTHSEVELSSIDSFQAVCKNCVLNWS